MIANFSKVAGTRLTKEDLYDRHLHASLFLL